MQHIIWTLFCVKNTIYYFLILYVISCTLKWFLILTNFWKPWSKILIFTESRIRLHHKTSNESIITKLWWKTIESSYELIDTKCILKSVSTPERSTQVQVSIRLKTVIDVLRIPGNLCLLFQYQEYIPIYSKYIIILKSPSSSHLKTSTHF